MLAVHIGKNKYRFLVKISISSLIQLNKKNVVFSFELFLVIANHF